MAHQPDGSPAAPTDDRNQSRYFTAANVLRQSPSTNPTFSDLRGWP